MEHRATATVHTDKVPVFNLACTTGPFARDGGTLAQWTAASEHAVPAGVDRLLTLQSTNSPRCACSGPACYNMRAPFPVSTCLNASSVGFVSFKWPGDTESVNSSNDCPDD